MKENPNVNKYRFYVLTSVLLSLILLLILSVIYVYNEFKEISDLEKPTEVDNRILIELKDIYGIDFTIETIPCCTVSLTRKNKTKITKNTACKIYKHFIDYDSLKDEAGRETYYIFFAFYNEDKLFVFRIIGVENNKCIFSTEEFD